MDGPEMIRGFNRPENAKRSIAIKPRIVEGAAIIYFSSRRMTRTF